MASCFISEIPLLTGSLTGNPPAHVFEYHKNTSSYSLFSPGSYLLIRVPRVLIKLFFKKNAPFRSISLNSAAAFYQS